MSFSSILRRAGVGLSVILLCCGTALAGSSILEAQQLLNSLGYDAGPNDGQYGRRTGAAAAAFFSEQGLEFDGSIDEAEVAALRDAAADYALVLRHPGRLFDHSHGRASRCNALESGNITAGAIDPTNYPPVRALNDAASIGDSAQWNQAEQWVKAVVTLAALYDTRKDNAAGKKAAVMLAEWAAAEAITATPVDQSYKGRGNADRYRPSASAPVLDMENAAQLGYAVLYTLEMLDDAISDAERTLVANWANDLIAKYGGPISAGIFQSRPTGIWRLEGRPIVALAAVTGDEDTYADYVSATYEQFRKAVNKDGAILKNVNRGDRAIHYQSQGILSMASLFDLVENQGSRIPRDLEEKLHASVTFLLDADADNAKILPYAKQGYNNPGRGQNPVRYYRESAEHYWWMVYYLARFPDHANGKRLRDFIDRNDSAARIDRRVMSTVWVPYPINCYRPFDMSAEAVTAAKDFVAANFQPPADEPKGERKIARVGRTSGATPLAVGKATVTERSRDKAFIEYGVSLANVTIDGDELFIPGFSVFTDYRGNPDEVSNIQLLRLVFMRETLIDDESKAANYLPCGALAAAARDSGRQQLRLHVGNEADKNKCILSKMSDHDQKIWASILDGFGSALATSGNSDAAAALTEVYNYVVD